MKISKRGPKTGNRHHPKRCPEMMPGADRILKPKCKEPGGGNHRPKRIFCLMALAVFSLWLTSAASWAADSPCVHSHGEVEVWAGAVPVIGRLPNLADHTYVAARHQDGHLQQWGCFGRDHGGRILPASFARSGALDTNTICFMASRSPCKWPAIPFYMVVGVCHQLANRGLFTAGTTVAGARAYGLSRWFYGPYGKAIRLPIVWNYRMNNCWARAQHAKATPLRIIYAAYSPAEKSKEYLLYQEYLPKLKNAGEDEQYNLMNKYRRDVVSMNLKTAGAGKDDQKKVLAFYDDSLPKLEKLMENRLKNEGMTRQEYFEQMDALLKETQERLQNILSKAQYEKFTDAPYDEILVWEDFMDEPTKAMFKPPRP